MLFSSQLPFFLQKSRRKKTTHRITGGYYSEYSHECGRNLWRNRERYPFVSARARLSRLPLFLVHGTTTPRVKHADEGLFSAFLLSSSLFPIAQESLLFGDLPVVLTNQSKEGIRIRRAKSDAKARGCNESRRKCSLWYTRLISSTTRSCQELNNFTA